MMDVKDSIVAALNDTCDRFGENVTHVEDLQRLSGGASQETWSFFAVSPKKKTRFILRRSPFEKESAQGIGLMAEAEILMSLRGKPLPAPNVLQTFSRDHAIGPAYVMNAIAGETLPQKIMKDPLYEPGRGKIASQCGTALASLHAVDVSSLPELPYSTAADQIAQYENVLRANQVERPVLELAMQWLKANDPKTSDRALIHGDFRMGNLMIDSTGLVGILDWELCHLGDPLEDIGWLCVNSWRFGRRDLRAGGVGLLEDLLEAYEAAGGRHIAASEIDYWEMLGSFKWGAMCSMMYETFRNGTDPTIERGSIGRRISETEIDLMNLLEKL